MHEADIFQTMQADITYYQDRGKIFVMGDLNCRTSVKLDYVENDRFIQSRDSVEEVDTPIQRFSQDRGSN